MKNLDLKTAAAFYILSRMPAEAPVVLAGRLLADGIYTPAAADLLILSMQRYYSITEVGPLFQQLLRELGIPLPTVLDAKRTVVRQRFGVIVEGAVSPFEGLSMLYAEVDLPVREPGDPVGIDALHTQCHFYCEICFPELKEPGGRLARDKETIKLAERWLAEHAA